MDKTLIADYEQILLGRKKYFAKSFFSKVAFVNERNAIMQTVPNLPLIYTENEWEEISQNHYIHELGNVSNLSPTMKKSSKSA